MKLFKKPWESLTKKEKRRLEVIHEIKENSPVQTLYHGTSCPTQTFSDESCFTASLECANNYAYHWAIEMPTDTGGEIKTPYIMHVRARFFFVGGADQYKMVGTEYEVVKVVEMEA